MNETVTQLQNAEQDKTKLQKLLNESGDNKTVPVSVDQIDNKVVEDYDKITTLEMRITTLTETVKASENIAAELETIKGARRFISFCHCRDILANLMFVRPLKI